MLMAFLMFAKWWKFTTKKIVTSLIFILNVPKTWLKFIKNSKIKLKIFHLNLIIELFMCLMLKLLELILHFYSLGVAFFLSNL
jgi:hypothetical protein